MISLVLCKSPILFSAVKLTLTFPNSSIDSNSDFWMLVWSWANVFGLKLYIRPNFSKFTEIELRLFEYCSRLDIIIFPKSWKSRKCLLCLFLCIWGSKFFFFFSAMNRWRKLIFGLLVIVEHQISIFLSTMFGYLIISESSKFWNFKD